MKPFYLIFLCLAAAALLVTGCKNRQKAAEEAEAAEAEAAEAAEADSVKTAKVMDKLAQLPEEPVFDLVTSMGTIKIKLYAKTPKHRDNFAKLALSGFYDGLLFHRVINGTRRPAPRCRWSRLHGTGRVRPGIHPHQRRRSRRPPWRCSQSAQGVLRLPVLYRPGSGRLRPAGRTVYRLWRDPRGARCHRSDCPRGKRPRRPPSGGHCYQKSEIR